MFVDVDPEFGEETVLLEECGDSPGRTCGMAEWRLSPPAVPRSAVVATVLVMLVSLVWLGRSQHQSPQLDTADVDAVTQFHMSEAIRMMEDAEAAFKKESENVHKETSTNESHSNSQSGSDDHGDNSPAQSIQQPLKTEQSHKSDLSAGGAKSAATRGSLRGSSFGLSKNGDLLDALSHRAQVVAPAMSVQHVANMLQAYVGLHFWPGHETLAALGDRLQQLAPRMTPNQVATILQAYVGLKTRPVEPLMLALVDQATRSASDMEISDLVLVLNAFAVMNVKPTSSLWNALENKAATDTPKMSAHEVALTLRVHAQLGHRPSDALAQALGLRAAQQASQMEAQDVWGTLDSYASLNMDPGDFLLHALLSRAEQVAPDMNAKEVAGTLNAYAQLEQGTAVVQ